MTCKSIYNFCVIFGFLVDILSLSMKIKLWLKLETAGDPSNYFPNCTFTLPMRLICLSKRVSDGMETKHICVWKNLFSRQSLQVSGATSSTCRPVLDTVYLKGHRMVGLTVGNGERNEAISKCDGGQCLDTTICFLISLPLHFFPLTWYLYPAFPVYSLILISVL